MTDHGKFAVVAVAALAASVATAIKYADEQAQAEPAKYCDPANADNAPFDLVSFVLRYVPACDGTKGITASSNAEQEQWHVENVGEPSQDGWFAHGDSDQRGSNGEHNGDEQLHSVNVAEIVRESIA